MHLLTVLYCSAKEEAIRQRRLEENGQSDTSHGISDLLAPSPFMHARWSRRAELFSDIAEAFPPQGSRGRRFLLYSGRAAKPPIDLWETPVAWHT